MNTEELKIRKAREDFNFKLATGLTTFMGFLGVFFFFIKGLAFIDAFMLIYILFYGFSVGGIFLFTKKSKIPQVVISFVVAMIMIAVVNVKIGWSNDYYSRTEPFIFSDHIDEYPTWERQFMISMTGQPDWVNFAKGCADSGAKGKRLADVCADKKLIRKKYNINIDEELNAYLKRMQYTVVLINKYGEMPKRKYISCIKKRDCAEIPLLSNPEEYPEEIEPTEGQAAAISRAYWALVEKSPLTPELCEYITLCKVMRKTGAVQLIQ